MTKGNDIEKAFGKVIRELRMAQNISQEKLAEISDLDRSYVSEIERGEKTVSIKTIYKLSKGLNCKPYFIIKKTDAKVSRENLNFNE